MVTTSIEPLCTNNRMYQFMQCNNCRSYELRKEYLIAKQDYRTIELGKIKLGCIRLQIVLQNLDK